MAQYVIYLKSQLQNCGIKIVFYSHKSREEDQWYIRKKNRNDLRKQQKHLIKKKERYHDNV